jgi:hypothetical protein
MKLERLVELMWNSENRLELLNELKNTYPIQELHEEIDYLIGISKDEYKNDKQLEFQFSETVREMQNPSQ